MRFLFVSGAGITPDQRIERWKMVSSLYAQFGQALRSLGHRTYFYVHPDALHDDLPPHMTWADPDHEHFDYVLESFRPDFVFCWNGSSPGDRITATLAAAGGAQMVYSEQGWFPQSKTLYFDMSGANARCGTRNRTYSTLNEADATRLLDMRRSYIQTCGVPHLFDPLRFEMSAPDLSKPVFVPLQDERDLNIVQDSPFKTMDAFVEFLTTSWPDLKFRIRPHPKYPDPALRDRPNVEKDSPRKPMFESLAECGMVMGINSTVLLESALLGKTVVSFGESLATGTGLLCDARPDTPFDPASARVDEDVAAAVLLALLKKQMLRASLSKPVDVLRSAIFADLRRYEQNKPLGRD